MKPRKHYALTIMSWLFRLGMVPKMQINPGLAPQNFLYHCHCRTTKTLVPLQSKEGTLARKLTEVASRVGQKAMLRMCVVNGKL